MGKNHRGIPDKPHYQVINELRLDIKSLEEENNKLREGLGWFFDRYIALAESGDCGNWNPYDEKEVREAANLLKEQGK